VKGKGVKTMGLASAQGSRSTKGCSVGARHISPHWQSHALRMACAAALNIWVVPKVFRALFRSCGPHLRHMQKVNL